MTARTTLRPALLVLCSIIVGTALGLALAARPVAAEEACPDNRCNVISGYCYHQAGSGRFCTHTGGEQGCYNTFCCPAGVVMRAHNQWVANACGPKWLGVWPIHWSRAR